MTTINLADADSVAEWLCDGRRPVEASFSLIKLAALIGKALEMDGLKVDSGVILDVLCRPMGNQADQLDAATVFLYGSDWIVGLAEHFGFQGEADGFVDTEWLKDRPHMSATYEALTMMAVRAMSAATDMYEAQNGHSMIEVFLASTETGESFDQSRTRLAAQRKGLRAVH